MKDVMHAMVIKNCVALNPKIYMHNHTALNEEGEIVIETANKDAV